MLIIAICKYSVSEIYTDSVQLIKFVCLYTGWFFTEVETTLGAQAFLGWEKITALATLLPFPLPSGNFFRSVGHSRYKEMFLA